MNAIPNSLNNAEFKKAMRKYDFPQCAREALARVGMYAHCHRRPSSTKIPTVCFLRLENLCATKKNQDHCMEIISEYIFFEKKWMDSRKSNAGIGLSVFQEFHLVLVFAEFFSRPGPDVTRNAVFLSLFGSSSLASTRARVLSKFVSTAISDSIAPVSQCIGCSSNWNCIFFF